MNPEESKPNSSKTQLSGELNYFQKTMARLGEQNIEARKSLVEDVARNAHFSHLDELSGRRPEDFPGLLEQVTEGYLNGRFFLEQMSLFYEVSPSLSLTVYMLRQQWVKDYDLNTVPEFMILDQAVLAYFHVVRLNKEVANMLSLTEHSLYSCDKPFAKLQTYHRINNNFDHFEAEEHIRKLQNILLPFTDRFNVMFLRNLRVLRELKNNPVNINIGQGGQLNLAQQQVNIQQQKKASGKRPNSKKAMTRKKRAS